MANAHRICEAMGITLHRKAARHAGGVRLPPRHTWSRATIKTVHDNGVRWGLPEHVYDVLGLILEADSTQLYGDVIQGVSTWALRWRLTTAEVPFIMPAFRAIDLYGVRQAVIHHRMPERHGQIGFLISGMMEPAMRGIGK